MRALLLIVCLAMVPTSAHAERWYRGKYGKNRVTHLVITTAGGGIFLTSEAIKGSIAPETCHWCDPPSIDRWARNDAVWGKPANAAAVSNITGYALAPAFALGVTFYASFGEGDGTTATVVDDVVPILETVVLSQLAVNALKFGVGRQRPYAHFGPGMLHGPEDNLSFPSGHSALAFGVATSAGMVAHMRGYKTEPYVWGVGMGLGVSTAYLRMAADKHYLTDVITGSAIGVAAGLTVPLLMRRPRADLTVVPTGNGVSIAGTF